MDYLRKRFLAYSFLIIAVVFLVACAAGRETSAQPIPDDEAKQMMDTLVSGTRDEIEGAIARILAADDQRFNAVFIELLRGSQLALAAPSYYNTYIDALEELSGQDFGANWPAWVEWYGATDLEPPPGFTSWKGELFAKLDQDFAQFFQEDHPATIRVEEVQWGGVPLDGIPALDNPDMLTAEGQDYLEPSEPVFGIALNGEARAYPLRIMDWHEMANDVVGGVPVSLAYCTLCGAGIAFDGRASNSVTYDFGSSGLLYRSNKLMYDRQTKTLWNHLTGEPVLGELVGEVEPLELLPVVLTTWEEWLAQHPDTLVLDIETGYDRVYEPGAAYGDYFATSGTMFPVWQRSDLLEDKARVYALRVDGTPRAYPLDILTEARVVNDTIGEIGVVLVAGASQVEVEGSSLRSGATVNYLAGGEVRAYERGEFTFSLGEEAGTLVDGEGGTWEVTEEALIGPEGQRLPRVNGHLAYWFGWFSFFPNTEVYGVEE